MEGAIYFGSQFEGIESTVARRSVWQHQLDIASHLAYPLRKQNQEPCFFFFIHSWIPVHGIVVLASISLIEQILHRYTEVRFHDDSKPCQADSHD